jgi:MFS family permease
MSNATLTGDAQGNAGYTKSNWTLGILSIALIIIGLDVTVLNVAIPTLQAELNASASGLQWIINTYILVFAGVLLTMGSLGDRFRRRLAFQTGLIVFGLASVGAAFSENTTQLIIARAAQGIGGALIMSSTLSVIVDVFPREERAKAIGIWAGVAAIGIPGGMIAGGYLLENFFWGSVFLLNVPVVAVALIGSFVLIPESKDVNAKTTDVIGAIISMVSLSALIYAIIEAPEKGWLSGVTIAGFVIAIAAGALFVWYENRREHPMVDLKLFKNARLSASVGAIGIAFMAMLRNDVHADAVLAVRAGLLTSRHRLQAGSDGDGLHGRCAVQCVPGIEVQLESRYDGRTVRRSSSSRFDGIT